MAASKDEVKLILETIKGYVDKETLREIINDLWWVLKTSPNKSLVKTIRDLKEKINARH